MAALALQKMKKKVVQTARRRWTAPDKDRIRVPLYYPNGRVTAGRLPAQLTRGRTRTRDK